MEVAPRENRIGLSVRPGCYAVRWGNTDGSWQERGETQGSGAVGVTGIMQYLRWLKHLSRRLRIDIADEFDRQRWWAQGVSISRTAIIRAGDHSVLEIGAGSLIGDYTILDLQNDPLLQPPVTSKLIIGRRTGINEFSNIRAANGTIVIGDNCLISQFVSVIAANHSTERGTLIRDQPADRSSHSVVIGDDVWIGANAVILPGVTIGAGSVVAAGSVVTADVPEYVVVAGVPAQVKRRR